MRKSGERLLAAPRESALAPSLDLPLAPLTAWANAHQRRVDPAAYSIHGEPSRTQGRWTSLAEFEHRVMEALVHPLRGVLRDDALEPRVLGHANGRPQAHARGPELVGQITAGDRIGVAFHGCPSVRIRSAALPWLLFTTADGKRDEPRGDRRRRTGSYLPAPHGEPVNTRNRQYRPGARTGRSPALKDRPLAAIPCETIRKAHCCCEAEGVARGATVPTR
jgi:hypothetical protein